MYRHRNMATTQVAQAEKNRHKHMIKKVQGGKLKMADSHRDGYNKSVKTRSQIHKRAVPYI